MISDAPLGLTLSGGVDTSGLLVLARELEPDRDIHTYSIKINEPSFDESRYQEIMVRHSRTIHHQVTIDPEDVAEHLVAHMAYMDEPSGDGAAIPSYLLAKEAKKTVSVLLSGEGGDEVFDAYETHGAYKMRRAYLRYTPAFLRHGMRFIASHLPTSYKKLSFDFLAKRFTMGAEMDLPEAHLYWRHVFTEAEKQRLMSVPAAGRFPPTSRYFSDTFNQLRFSEELNKIAFIDIRYYFIDDLMVKNDRTMMAHSVEARFPYMDRKLVEFCARLPVSLKIKGLRRRYIQKLVLRDLLPPEIYHRQNMGLEMPHSLWFLSGLKGFCEKYFSKEHVERTGVLSHRFVQELWEEHQSGRRDNGRALWCVLSFIIWFDMFVWNKDFKKYLTNKIA
jgi:asparagine synthase (glutamine-hydrolysing)